MSKVPIHPVPIEDGKRSVLSGKDAIRGFPKSESKSVKSRSDDNCESVLSGPECVGGVREAGTKGHKK